MAGCEATQVRWVRAALLADCGTGGLLDPVIAGQLASKALGQCTSVRA